MKKTNNYSAQYKTRTASQNSFTIKIKIMKKIQQSHIGKHYQKIGKNL